MAMSKSGRELSNDIGAPVVRPDAWAKCRGQAGYLDEMNLPGMLHARTVRSARPRARIVSLQVPPLPQGYILVDNRDVPGLVRPRLLAQDYPIFADGQVNYVGEAICLVAGPDREVVWDICDQIKVEYEDLPPILDLEDSLAAREPVLAGKDNVFIRRGFERGQVDQAFDQAARVFSGEYQTGYQEHLYLETLRITACWEDDEMIIYGPCQGPDPLPRFLAQIFGWEQDRFRAICTTVGGGFGGKIEPPIILAAHAALAAYKSKRPVQLVYDRQEDITWSTKRHPSRIKIRSALDADNNITAMEINTELIAGAYTWFCPVILDIALKMACNAYRIPSLRVKGSAHATNHIMPGAQRGFGAMQSIFAMETHLSQIAAELGMDPLEFKARHAQKTGDVTCTGGKLHDQVNLPAIMESIERRSGYRQKRAQWAKQQGRFRKGIGTAIYAFGAPHTIGQGPRRQARPLAVRRGADGRVEILTNIVDLGQGIETTFKKIVSAVLDVPLEEIGMPRPDSKLNPPTLGTGASLSIVLFGKSLERAARRLKERWNESGEITITEDYEEPDYLEWNEETMIGDSFHTYSWGGLAVEVEVDTLTGGVRVTGAWAAHDIGTPIDRTIAEGQVQGAVMQGIAFGLMENLESKDGFLQQTSLADYIIASSMDFPGLDHEFISSYYPHGPFGAKSVGEMPIIGGAPAVAEAISHACGVKISRVPITQERLLSLLAEKEARA